MAGGSKRKKQGCRTAWNWTCVFKKKQNTEGKQEAELGTEGKQLQQKRSNALETECPTTNTVL